MTTRIPPLNPLRTFEAAARHLSFTKAAEELFVTAAAVSHQIKVLERSLGVKLFTRAGGTLALTDIGQAYLPAIQQAFKQVIDATNQLHQRKDITTLKINASSTFSVKWLLPRLDAFLRQHPDIELKLSTSNHMIDFSREDLDLVIRYGTGNYPGMRSEKCFSVEAIPVCSPKLLEHRPPLKHPSELAGFTLLHDGSDHTHPNWRNWFDHVIRLLHQLPGRQGRRSRNPPVRPVGAAGRWQADLTHQEKFSLSSNYSRLLGHLADS